MSPKEQKQERKANLINIVFIVLVLLYMAFSLYGCTPSKGAASMIEPTISRLEAEIANPTLTDSVRALKLDSLRHLNMSKQISDVILSMPKKVKKSNINIAFGGNIEATGQSIGDEKVKDNSKVKDQSKVKTRTVTKTITKTAAPWWMWSVIIGLALLSVFLLLTRFLTGFLKIPFLSKG